jgi:hypothetical protein
VAIPVNLQVSVFAVAMQLKVKTERERENMEGKIKLMRIRKNEGNKNLIFDLITTFFSPHMISSSARLNPTVQIFISLYPD